MIRVGILGAGGMGNAHARQYRKMPDVEAIFFDKDIARTERYQTQWDLPAAVSADDLINTCDIVDICLPTDLHMEYGRRAIAAGKAVFIEKPLGRTVDECVELVNAASVAGVPLMPGQVVRYFPEFKEGNRLVKRGSVGTPAAARTRRGGLPPMGGADNWFMDFERSGGVLLDLAIHDFDWLRWTLGEVTQVYSRSVGATRGSGPDYALTTLSFDGGAVAHVESTWMDPSGFRTMFEVAGSAGIIEYDSRQKASLRTHLVQEQEGVKVSKTLAESNYVATDDPYYQELRAFVDAVRSGSPPPVTGHDGIMAVAIASAALESAKTGRAIQPASLV